MKSIFVDFNNVDVDGRIRLNVNGALADIEAQHIELKNGLKLLLDDKLEFQVIGTAEFSEMENIWVAKMDWDNLR